MRTDEDRRRALKLSDLRRERDRVGHERDLLRQRLATAVSRRQGWRDPEAVALSQEIAGVVSEWSRFNEAVRAILQEDI